jgi:hypothetical protein
MATARLEKALRMDQRFFLSPSFSLSRCLSFSLSPSLSLSPALCLSLSRSLSFSLALPLALSLDFSLLLSQMNQRHGHRLALPDLVKVNLVVDLVRVNLVFDLVRVDLVGALGPTAIRTNAKI